MKELVAKRYIKALMQVCSDNELKSLLDELNKISPVYKLDKFITIIESPDVTKAQKLEFVTSLVDSKDAKMVNLLKLLGEKDRLLLVPELKKELQIQISNKENIYDGEVISDWDISAEQIQKLESGFGKKFGATVKLKERKTDYPGIKIAVDGLGVEASFSVERLKAQITEHILKAI